MTMACDARALHGADAELAREPGLAQEWLWVSKSCFMSV